MFEPLQAAADPEARREEMNKYDASKNKPKPEREKKKKEKKLPLPYELSLSWKLGCDSKQQV